MNKQQKKEAASKIAAAVTQKLRDKARNNGFASKGNRAILHVPVTPANNRQVVSAPQAVGKRMQSELSVTNGSRRGSIRVRGQDWLGRVVASASEVPGYVYLEIYINPLEIPGTRLALFAQLYDKFRFGLLKFHFVPSSSTQTSGAVILAYDRDVSDATPPQNDNGVRQFLSMMDAVSSPVWAPVTAVCPLSHPEEGLWSNPVIGGDDRLAYQGQLYVACMEPSSATPGKALGDIFMEYDIEFFDPQLDVVVPLTTVGSTGGALYLGPTGLDALRPFVSGGNATITTKGLNVVPKLDGTLSAYLELAQGLYRFTNLVNQTIAGAVQYNAPTCAANTPKSAPAPQPIVQPLASFTSNAVGNTAQSSYYIAVPPGGGKVYQTFTNPFVTGLSGTSDGFLNIEKLSHAWINPASILT